MGISKKFLTNSDIRHTFLYFSISQINQYSSEQMNYVSNDYYLYLVFKIGAILLHKHIIERV